MWSLTMDELRLPWSKREGLVYGGIISIITCTIMCLFNVFRSAGQVNMEVFINGLLCIPILWILVMLTITFVVEPIARRFVEKYTEPTDSFYTKIVFNIIACVLMMSMIYTILGSLVGHIFAGDVSADIILMWPSNWPVNFCVAFWVEMLIAQPIARLAMKRWHLKQIEALESAGDA